MANDEVETLPEAGRPQRRAHWRGIVASGILVVGAAVAAPVLFGQDGTARHTPAPMMGAGHTTAPGQVMPGMMPGSGPMVAPGSHMDMMKSHMADMGAMMGGVR